jgi:hypothetical protein
MIDLGKIAAQTDQVGEANRQRQLAENNDGIRFIARVLEKVNNLSTALKTQAETHGSPKERKICKLDENEFSIYTLRG